ncbi:exosortase-associated protein EpsI, B-type [Caldimonas tepidiphila]|uniref:exosortase-associated protein EpsI, B-type n=1 Tax=Caldimonas tepidiphila TaxID=2315841 RepID=UPI000E5B9D35|nr:exosortase-associated protein EpsI, B-type [Caldimonas tepidiphila]
MNAAMLRSLLLMALMLAAAGMAVLAKPTQRLAESGPRVELETLFPKQFGSWRIDESVPVVLPPPDQQAVLDKIYNQVLARTYVDGEGQRVMLSVAYGGDQSDSMQVHRPEVCYPAQGFQVMSTRADALEIAGRNVAVTRLVTRMGGRVEPLTYWMVVGDKVPATRTQQKLAQLAYGLTGRIPDGMLVRASTIDTDSRRAWEVQDRFLRELAAHVDPARQTRILGAAASAL